MKKEMFTMALGALGDMAAERAGSTSGERLDGADMTGQYGFAVTLQVVLAMPTQNIGNSGHCTSRS
jgi:hypothetical protein